MLLLLIKTAETSIEFICKAGGIIAVDALFLTCSAPHQAEVPPCLPNISTGKKKDAAFLLA